MIGHKDATPAEGYSATPNIVLADIYPDNFSLNVSMIGKIEPSLDNVLSKLCGYFVKQCEAKLSGLKKLYLSEFTRHPPGEYELVISEPPADWLIPWRPKHGADSRTP